MQTYKLPPAFYFDHVRRDLPGGTIVKQANSYVVVELTDDECSELLSDAKFYAEAGVQEFGFECAGLVRSAKATVKALTSQGA